MRKETVVIRETDLPEKIEQLINEAVRLEKNIKVIAYTIIPITETGLRTILERVLERYGKPELVPTVAMILKELALNAAKANFKRIMFASRNLDIDNEVDYEIGMRDFKAAISEDWAIEYGRRSKNQKRRVEILFNFDMRRLIVKVRNNFPMSSKEETRIREKLSAAMEYEDVGEFFAHCGDDTEGAGLGLVLIMTALKSYGIDPHAFTIAVDGQDATVASLEIPLSPDYVLSRYAPEKRKLYQ